MTQGEYYPVSVIVPCHNEPRHRIRETLTSIYAARPSEVVLIDDGSDDQVTSDVLYPCRIGIKLRLQRQDHGGISAALNHGVELSRMPYVAILSVGDVMDEDKLALQHAFMVEHGYRATYHHYRGERGAYDLSRLATDNQFCASTAMVESSLFARDGLWFDETLQYCVDWDWSCRVQFEGPGWNGMDDVLGACHELPGGHTDRARTGERAARRARDRATVVKRWRRYG